MIRLCHHFCHIAQQLILFLCAHSISDVNISEPYFRGNSFIYLHDNQYGRDDHVNMHLSFEFLTIASYGMLLWNGEVNIGIFIHCAKIILKL